MTLRTNTVFCPAYSICFSDRLLNAALYWEEITHDLLDRLEGEMGTADHLRTMGQLMEDTLAQVEARVEGSRNGITGIPTGFTDLDKLTAGWQRGDLDVIAARPAAGKTGANPGEALASFAGMMGFAW